ncbi:MAG: hypothetical protein PHX40_00755 [Bacilli bacterium]|nr:hypothetical protein [Bacilli bacterium]
MKKYFAILGIVVLLVVVGYLVFMRNNTEGYSYVLLKINPEVELGVDADNVVREVTPLNEDADILLSDMELLGKPIEDVAEEIIDNTVEIGQLQNTIELTVMNASEETRLQLENKVKTKIEAHIKEKNYNAELTVKGVTEEMKASADNYDISYGKMLLISKAIEMDPALSEADLATKEVKDIQGYIHEVVEERHDEKGKSDEELEAEWKLRKTELKSNSTKPNNSDSMLPNNSDSTNANETPNSNQDGRTNVDTGAQSGR